jgi:hypothetical protein
MVWRGETSVSRAARCVRQNSLDYFLIFGGFFIANVTKMGVS